MGLNQAGQRKLYGRQLEMFDAELPLGGVSPRFLTEAWQRFTFGQGGHEANPVAHEEDVLIEEQYQRFLQNGENDGPDGEDGDSGPY